jgi:hypothetical protein
MGMFGGGTQYTGFNQYPMYRRAPQYAPQPAQQATPQIAQNPLEPTPPTQVSTMPSTQPVGKVSESTGITAGQGGMSAGV